MKFSKKCNSADVSNYKISETLPSDDRGVEDPCFSDLLKTVNTEVSRLISEVYKQHPLYGHQGDS